MSLQSSIAGQPLPAMAVLLLTILALVDLAQPRASLLRSVGLSAVHIGVLVYFVL